MSTTRTREFEPDIEKANAEIAELRKQLGQPQIDFVVNVDTAHEELERLDAQLAKLTAKPDAPKAAATLSQRQTPFKVGDTQLTGINRSIAANARK